MWSSKDLLQHNDFVIDFGEVGYRNSSHPFRVRLSAQPLLDLIAATQLAHRMYELLLIRRPGDVWAYVSVVPEQLPPELVRRLGLRPHATAGGSPEQPLEAPRTIPFLQFDAAFYWAGDDTLPEDSTWLNYRDTAAIQAYANQVLGVARAAQNAMDGHDHLLRYACESFRDGSHSFTYLDAAVAIKASRKAPPREPTFTPAFYERLEKLLQDDAVVSVTYSGGGDYTLLRMLAEEQRKRAIQTGHSLDNAFHISALVNHEINNTAWGSRIHFFMEGCDPGHLYINDGTIGPSAKGMVISGDHRAGSLILTSYDSGEIPGYSCESGDGWYYYRALSKTTRRYELDRLGMCRWEKLGFILRFGDGSDGLFEFEKAVFVIGASVSHEARVDLARVIREWQDHKGDPLLIVIGDQTAFLERGCMDVYGMPPELPATQEEYEKLSTLLWRKRPWMDTLIALHAPHWIAEMLQHKVREQHGPWTPWVVCTEEVAKLVPDLILQGDLAPLMRDAIAKAKEVRSHFS